MREDLLRALRTDDPEDIEQACEVALREARQAFSQHLPAALSGSRGAAFVYVARWRQAKNSVLRSLHDVQPDLVVAIGDELYVADVKNWPSLASSLLLDNEALEAPFSSWVTMTNDVGIGTCAALIQKVREITPGLHPLALTVNALPHFEQTEAQFRAFRRHVIAALNESDPALERIRQVFDLSLTQLGELFGVSRQAVTQWVDTGVPEDRLEKVAVVAAVADLLDYRLRSDRIPAVVRRDAAAYGGFTALEMISQDKHHELLDLIRSSFDWSVPA